MDDCIEALRSQYKDEPRVEFKYNTTAPAWVLVVKSPSGLKKQYTSMSAHWDSDFYTGYIDNKLEELTDDSV